MPVVPYSISNTTLIPGSVFKTRKNNCSTRFTLSRKFTTEKLTPQSFLLPLSASFRLFPPYSRGCSLHHNRSSIHLLSATGTDVAVEEPDSPVADEDSSGVSEVPSEAEISGKSSVKFDASPSSAQPKRSRPVKKSEMPPVKNEELVVGATFTGKVRSIQPFGAFIDFGAFTDGLVHVSRLSDSFVKDVGSVVSIGQEVKVRLVEANLETGRISLTMRESDDASKLRQQEDAPASSDKAGRGRRNASKPGQRKGEVKKISKFFKGQDLEGTVKNKTRAGAFIALPEGEEGFLPISEEIDEGFGSAMGESSLETGQEVSVRVLRISRGQVTLTMKKEEDVKKMDLQLKRGVVHTATNPFVLAFRKNKDIAAFLDEREKVEEDELVSSDDAVSSAVDETVEDVEGSSKDAKVGAIVLEDAPADAADSKEDPETTISDSTHAVDETVEDGEASSTDAEVGASGLEDASINAADSKEDPETTISDSADNIDDQVQTIEKTEVSSDVLATEGTISAADSVIKVAASANEVEADGKLDSSAETAEQILSSESSTDTEATEQQADDVVVKDELQVQTPPAENEIPSAPPSGDEEVATDPDKNGSIPSSVVQPDDSSSQEAKDEVKSDGGSDLSQQLADEQALSPESSTIEAVKGLADNNKDELQTQTPNTESDVLSASKIEDDKVEAVPKKNDSATNSNGQTAVPSPNESVTKATISPALVKQLREETGAGMMDCKKALAETGGDIVKAQEFLRKKGLASAEKKASRATAEGRIGSYIHDSRIGVLVEVNCETDFVSRGEIFKELVDDLAMQVAACPQVKYLVTEDVPKEIVDKEKEIEMQKEDLLSKPEQIRSKIVEGRIKKRLEDLALLEQPYIKNDKVVVKDWVKQTIATIGENIKVKRFVRYNLGEGLEKKSQDFAAEVAAQTAAKPVQKEQAPAVEEIKETVEKPPSVTISAALVKQLREETGAGMMDCKKALSETGGDIEKAQEYLRKKGLSSADKKSSRLAAEGRIGSYIHDSRIGVLIEVNSETDFVGRSENFKELVDDLAMQVVACPQVQFVSVEDIPESIVKKEKELEMQREDLQSKPENIREKIVEGRISKRLGELALLEQPFIKNDSILVKDLIKQTVATIGENIKVRRFVRFTLGETVDNANIEAEA
ncbi:polyprotein of EF-Ts, chloroplastic isoform X2 [Ziziphus jujuba]|uniref:Elongation factor Ts, mitochondrial n=1 Tax=Ziziphus jujuba TaxID=326968 RepID=A0ABM3I5F0_ZIZJJ|nr:polyprotein of EF-Ts, chloroplastic isoform X2 [Ziziphus jujuba]